MLQQRLSAPQQCLFPKRFVGVKGDRVFGKLYIAPAVANTSEPQFAQIVRQNVFSIVLLDLLFLEFFLLGEDSFLEEAIENLALVVCRKLGFTGLEEKALSTHWSGDDGSVLEPRLNDSPFGSSCILDGVKQSPVLLYFVYLLQESL
jgi:hypothetical protein